MMNSATGMASHTPVTQKIGGSAISERRMKEFEANNENDYLPLRDVVIKTLRTSILTGELKPGERLMEIHLADKLGVSRTPIRAAIRKLELQALVTKNPRRGAEVAQITD